MGFSVDEAGARRVEAVAAGVAIKVADLGLKAESSALAVVNFTANIAGQLDALYSASRRTGATVEGIKRIGFAASQAGGRADAARGSLENLATFIRTAPDAAQSLSRMGVQTRTGSGQLRDMSAIFSDVGQQLSQMPPHQAEQSAQMLGIDNTTLQAMRHGIGQFSGEYTAMARAIGFNADQAAVSANRFMTTFRSFGEMSDMVRDKIGASLAEGLAGPLDTLRHQVMDNFPKIDSTITAVVNGALWLGETLGRMAYRLIQLTGDIIDGWASLDNGTRQVIEVLGLLVAAWRLLDMAFSMSPVGRIVMVGAALLALYDDYKTWQEGGQSLIDWHKWAPGIDYAQKAFSSLGEDFSTLYEKVKSLGSALVDLGKRFLGFINIDTSKFHGKWLFDQIIESVRSSISVLGSLVDALRKVVSGDFSGAWSSLKDAAGAWVKSPVVQGAVAVGQGIVDKVSDWWNGDSTTQHAQATKRGERNNNPGNLNFVGQSGASLERPGGRFARFDTAFDGLRALSRQLMLYAGRGINSVEKIISTWAPASDNNSTAAYIQAVSQGLGVNPRAALNMQNPQIMSALMNSIIHHENGRNIYSRDLVNRGAASGIGGRSDQFQQQNTYYIYGGNAQDIGREVGRQVGDNAGRMRTRQVRRG
nr:lytic transglycosylase [Shimwellia pseudoproteus]